MRCLFGESETGSKRGVIKGAVGDLGDRPESFSSSDHSFSFKNRDRTRCSVATGLTFPCSKLRLGTDRSLGLQPPGKV